MKKKIIKITGIISGGFVIFVAFGLSFFRFVVGGSKNKRQAKKIWYNLKHIKINHPRDKYENEYEEGKAWCREQNMEDFYITSIDDLLLHAKYLPAEDAKRYVILCHGYKGSGFGDFAYMARFLHESGCNLLFIDQRCCGESDGEYITFGAKEKYDVAKWAYYISKMNDSNLPIYLYGESMGASSVLMASGLSLPDEVKGIIADCGFCSMREQIKNMARDWFHLSRIELLLFRLDICCKIFGHFSMKEADTTLAMNVNRRPVLFFHGEKDTYVLSRNSKYNYAICKSPKELVIIPEARHICSPYVESELYRKKMIEFFEKYD